MEDVTLMPGRNISYLPRQYHRCNASEGRRALQQVQVLSEPKATGVPHIGQSAGAGLFT